MESPRIKILIQDIWPRF